MAEKQCCSFCGRVKKTATDEKGPKVVLVQNATNGKAICQHCINKSVALMLDPLHEDEQIIDINADLSPSVA